jgi:hypothetical protein
MRIESSPGQSLQRVYLWLTIAEATELRGALNDLLAGTGPEWHAHVSSSDFQVEVSVAHDDS